MTPCAVKDCGHVAVAYPEIRIWAATMPKAEHALDNCIRIRMTVPHCERHCLTTKPAGLITDESWRQISGQIIAQGNQPPDRESAAIAWLPLSMDPRA